MPIIVLAYMAPLIPPILGVLWAFGWFDEREQVYQWVQGRETPIVRWISGSGTMDGNELLEIDTDKVRLGD